ncbi:MAG: magnesium chelatase subunit D [Myxococcota bacterium]
MSPWQDALRAAAVFAERPSLGILVRARMGPARSRWLARLGEHLTRPRRRMPIHIADDRLLGGIDLEATLRAGRPVAQRGLLAESDGRVLEIPMAERLPPELVGHLCAVLDMGEVSTERDGLSLRSQARLGVVAFDEGATVEEFVPLSLAERLGLQVGLQGLGMADVEAPLERLPESSSLEGDLVRMCCEAALALGISSLRPPSMAKQAAELSAHLDGREEPSQADFAFALRCVLVPRATQMPQSEEQDSEPEPPEAGDPPPEQDSEPEREQPAPSSEDAEILTEIMQANLPSGLLEDLGARAGVKSAGKTGELIKGGARGRRLASRPGRPGPGSKVDVVATLRAAAPWQRLRSPRGSGPQVRLEDIRVERRQQRSETLTIFVVDASGSSALQRLAEAKGAVERVLADCYVRRDHVALIAFRGDGARLVLPPTRSLTRAKRELSGLAGGGPTPLADALRLARVVASDARRRGRSPLVVLMTDAKANVGLDGRRGRAAAQEDAEKQARGLVLDDVPTLLIETSPRPREEARRLATACGARWMFLPRLDADTIARAVGDVGS